MQFVQNGPDIPDALLRAHEDGRLVFFCGAGISYPAGLPGFGGLVDEIYRLNGTEPNEIEREAIDRSQFDAVLDLLERRLPGQRLAARRALAQALKPNLRKKGALDTHTALLNLSRCREGSLRLVTTNFDRLFHAAAKRMKFSFEAYAAPMLPIPKNSRWNGLAFLHGLLPEKGDESSLHRLVVSSGDFGLAYLAERWAARFVGELFRNYVVCFVGYSINDPVLRYMMDALAADRMLGESTPQAWAFGEFRSGQKHQKVVEWEAKGVTPILYEVSNGSQNHSALHSTLKAWATTYVDGTLGKERIVVGHALAKPEASTQQDDFVGRMLWALSDESALPAKRFAEFNPVPSLDWFFGAFLDERFGHVDLSRFGVSPRSRADKGLKFSLVRRPASYALAPMMALVFSDSAQSRWDDVMYQLARWLTRHLNDPRLLLWVARLGPNLNVRWRYLIEHELDSFASMERQGKSAELDEIRSQAPMAVPCGSMRKLWNLLLSGRVKSSDSDSDLYRWRERLQRDGLSASLRFELRQLLSPKVHLTQAINWRSAEKGSGSSDEDGAAVDVQLVLASENVQSALTELNGEDWERALGSLSTDLQQLLLDALDLAAELGEADQENDRSHWDLPSIEPHWQNRGYREWTILIELLRDSWVHIYKNNRALAEATALAWFSLPYPTFKRLSIFAASKDSCVPHEKWVEWLTIDDGWWLWSTETGREVHRLLVLQGKGIGKTLQRRLERVILAGPPRRMYRHDLSPQRWKELADGEVWLRLAKFELSGIELGKRARSRMNKILAEHPDLELLPNERDEFSHWMSGTGDPDFESSREISVAPRRRKELRDWLQVPMLDSRPLYEDTWRDVCRSRMFHSIGALCDLSSDGIWPAPRWREALQVWSEGTFASRTWRYVAPIVRRMPNVVLAELAHSVAWWIQEASKSVDASEEMMIGLCWRILNIDLEPISPARHVEAGVERPVSEAINHPVGLVAQAAINVWLESGPNDNESIPQRFKHLFTALCDVKCAKYVHGRVLLASRLIVLFRVDRQWTEEFLLPLFDWGNPVEAKAVWEGFLWSPRLYGPLLISFKKQFLQAAEHYTSLGEHRQQFAAFLTYAALGPAEGYGVAELRSAFAALPHEGLERSAQAMAQALEGAGERKEEYWTNHILPFWREVWPKSRLASTAKIGESLVRLSIAADRQFPTALVEVWDWLKPLDRPHYVVHLLKQSGMCIRYPNESIQLLEKVAGEGVWITRDLTACLEQALAASPSLYSDPRYLRLSEVSRRG